MKRILLGLSVLTLGLLPAVPAQAGHRNVNKIINSANGAFNSIAIHNRGYSAPYCPPQVPQVFPGVLPGAYGQPPYGPAPGVPGAAGVNVNSIRNSANGAYNSIAIGNGGLGYRFPGVSFGGVNVGGVNINVIANSGNGIGNSIGIVNH